MATIYADSSDGWVRSFGQSTWVNARTGAGGLSFTSTASSGFAGISAYKTLEIIPLEKLKKFGAVILLESNHEFIVQYAGTPEEITKLVKLLKNTKIIEQTRSGLVSMTTGTDYIKK